MSEKVHFIFITSIALLLLHCVPPLWASDALKDNVPSDVTTQATGWISTDPQDLEPIAGTSWLIIYELEDFDWADRVVIDDEVFTFADETVYLECYDLLGNFWGIAQYGEMSSHGGARGFMISYYITGETETDGEFYFWDFIKTNGLETGVLVIEAEDTGAVVGPLPNIGLRINAENYTPSVMPDVTGDDQFGLADIIWGLQRLSGLR